MDLHATGRFAGMEIAEIPLKLVFGCLNNRARSVRLRPSLERHSPKCPESTDALVQMILNTSAAFAKFVRLEFDPSSFGLYRKRHRRVTWNTITASI